MAVVMKNLRAFTDSHSAFLVSNVRLPYSYTERFYHTQTHTHFRKYFTIQTQMILSTLDNTNKNYCKS